VENGDKTAFHIVVVDDEVSQRRLLDSLLAAHGFRVTTFDGGAGLRALLETEAPDLLLLDVCMPDEDGYSLARHVRQRRPQVGILMLSGAGEPIDRIQGLEAGADDYLTKPFETRELVARVRSVLRRACVPSADSGAQVRMGRCVVDLAQRLLMDGAGARPIEKLTASECDLLRTFAANPHRPLERDWLMAVVNHRERTAEDRSIDLRITRLRRKIEYNPANPHAIRTVRGVGYMFIPEAS
jgi:DNA-binding response OmpR family regulator